MSDIEVKFTPPDLIKRMERYPQQFDGVMKESANASLLVIHENVPAYPKQLPSSKYTRTGLLGQSMGVGQTGGQIGQPNIYLTKKIGDGSYQGEFGSSLNYAPDVIGDGTQKAIFKSRGWWATNTIAKRAAGKIIKVYEIAAKKMTQFIDGK